jgi:hypothetical protein
MSYHVGPVAIRGNPQEKEQVPEVLEVPQAPSFVDTNIFPEQGKPRFIPPIILIFYF